MQKACGGVSDVKKADAKIQGIVDNVIIWTSILVY